MASVKDMRYSHFDFTDCKTISRDDFDDLVSNKCSPERNDILISKDGANCLDIIFVYKQPEKIVLLSSIAIARLKQGYSPDFYRYFLLAPGPQAMMRNNYVSGSAIPRIVLKDFKFVPVPLPPLPTQRAIAHILGSLDDKIALLRKMNETLEQMAQALFQSWFVDFDPVIDKALAAGHDIPEPLQARAARRQALGDQRKPLPPEIADLFPDAFTFHEDLGWVPEGWEVGKVKDIGENPRDSIQPNSILPETPYIGLQNMPQKSIALADWQTAEEISSNKYVFEKGDILFGKLRPYFHKVGIAPLRGICSTDILVVKPKQKYWLSLLLGHLSSDAFISYTTNSSSGTRMPRTNWKDMGNYPIAIPATKLSDYLSTLFQNYISQIDSNIHQMHSLTSLRDTLLPKLISGEVEV